MKSQKSALEVNDNKRVAWADVAKAFAIWLMVFAHANLNNETLICMIYTFHMPLFFLMSGYFDKGQGFSLPLLKKNFDALLIPYFVYSIIGLSICWISPYLHPELYYGMDSLPVIFKAAFKGMLLMEGQVRPTSFMPIGCLWFLPALFLCKVLWSIIILLYRCKYRYLSFIPICISYFAFSLHPDYLSIDSAVMGLPIYCIGFLIKEWNIVEKFLRKKYFCMIICLLSCLYVRFIGIRNGDVSMNGCVPGDNMLMFYINALIGSFAMISLSKVVASIELLQQIGASTLAILALHPFVIYACKGFAGYCFMVDMSNFPVWVSALIACLSCVLVVTIKSMFNLKWLK